jgi:hypothetical protein
MKILDQSCRRSESILAIFKGKLYCPHHPHDNTYVLLQERKPVHGQVWHSISLQNILGLQSSINISSLFYLPANLSLVYLLGKKIPPFLCSQIQLGLCQALCAFVRSLLSLSCRLLWTSNFIGSIDLSVAFF